MLKIETDFECVDCGVEVGCINPVRNEPRYDDEMTLVGLVERGRCDACHFGE